MMVTSMQELETVSKIIQGAKNAKEMINKLLKKSQWFSLEPLPDDMYLIAVKRENAALIGVPIESYLKTFDINLWDHVNLESINDILDGVLEKDGLPFGIAVDVDYACKGITSNGNITLIARYTKDPDIEAGRSKVLR
jgi:hypothetical protein